VVNALIGFWNGLDARRRGMLAGGAAALVVVLVILARLVTAPSYALLYAGLDPAAAGDVVAAVEARGVAYRVEGDAILVDRAQRDALRMALAGEGLPANGAAGYELLDSLSGFGTTSQMFDAAYWRAKEGELARTIAASQHIRAARVHIANPGSDPFQPAQDVTASVALRPAAGGLGPGHARALRYLVASSVPGLLPENVTVLDADSGQVLGGSESLTPGADAAARAEEMRQNIERLLAARVGPGNAVVQVNVALETRRETIRERRIDPDSRVAIATETEDRSNTSRDRGGNGVTVASNLPEGDAATGDGESSEQGTETRERITFDMSETQREIAREPGDIRRVTVAVLLNGVRRVAGDGTVTVEPRPPEEVAALATLVQSAVGYDAARGDTVTIESMAFDDSVAGDVVAPGLLDRMSLDLGRVIQTIVLTGAALFIVFGLLRPLLRRPEAAGGAPGASAQRGVAQSGAAALPEPETAQTAPATEAQRQVADGTAPDAPDAPDAGTGTSGALPALPAHAGGGAGVPDPVERLRHLIAEREEETVEILRSWMEEDEEIPQ
jgi:flagellar M-ring protein FliF